MCFMYLILFFATRINCEHFIYEESTGNLNINCDSTPCDDNTYWYAGDGEFGLKCDSDCRNVTIYCGAWVPPGYSDSTLFDDSSNKPSCILYCNSDQCRDIELYCNPGTATFNWCGFEGSSGAFIDSEMECSGDSSGYNNDCYMDCNNNCQSSSIVLYDGLSSACDKCGTEVTVISATRDPTATPTLATGAPTAQSAEPSRQPTSQPTNPPNWPTDPPSPQPTAVPSAGPTRQPTNPPSGSPTDQPSAGLTLQPTVQPSLQPSPQPTDPPSSQPTHSPTLVPSSVPTWSPTDAPSTAQPSPQPSLQPTNPPFNLPTDPPTVHPSTVQPTPQPSPQPTNHPSRVPSSSPTDAPSTAQPTPSPTRAILIWDETSNSHTYVCNEAAPCNNNIYYFAGDGVLSVTCESDCANITIYCGAFKPPGYDDSSLFDRVGNTVTCELYCSGGTTICTNLNVFCEPGSAQLRWCGIENVEASAGIIRQSKVECTGNYAQYSNQGTDKTCHVDCYNQCLTSKLYTYDGTEASCHQCGSGVTIKDFQTHNPSIDPTPSPTDLPTGWPTDLPTGLPTDVPTDVPTSLPTDTPTGSPTDLPTDVPTDPMTFEPTDGPSPAPTPELAVSTELPSRTPSSTPTTEDATSSPSEPPSTSSPSEPPSRAPSDAPSSPTELPTFGPSFEPTAEPSRAPTMEPVYSDESDDDDNESDEDDDGDDWISTGGTFSLTTVLVSVGATLTCVGVVLVCYFFYIRRKRAQHAVHQIGSPVPVDLGSFELEGCSATTNTNTKPPGTGLMMPPPFVRPLVQMQQPQIVSVDNYHVPQVMPVPQNQNVMYAQPQPQPGHRPVQYQPYQPQVALVHLNQWQVGDGEGEQRRIVANDFDSGTIGIEDSSTSSTSESSMLGGAPGAEDEDLYNNQRWPDHGGNRGGNTKSPPPLPRGVMKVVMNPRLGEKGTVQG